MGINTKNIQNILQFAMKDMKDEDEDLSPKRTISVVDE